MKTKYILIALFSLSAFSMAAQERTFQRNKVLVEKHTGLNCSNCPPADNAYNAYMNRHEGLAERTVLIRHNSYSPDNLQIASIHSALASKWGISGWPQYLIDRCDYEGTRFANPHGYHVSWGNFQSSSFNGVEMRLNTPTYVSLNLDGSAYDPVTRKLIVRARGEVTKDVPDLAVNIFLTQDSINGSTDHAYSKSSRTYVTKNLFGDPITVTDGWYDIYYEYTIEESYGRFSADPEKMNLVVFITSYDDYTYPFEDGKKDFTNSEVHNADEVRLNTLPTSTGPRCPNPEIALRNGQLVFTCEVPDVDITYTLSPLEAVATSGTDACAVAAFKVTAVARTEGYSASDPVSARFSLADVKESFKQEEPDPVDPDIDPDNPDVDPDNPDVDPDGISHTSSAMENIEGLLFDLQGHPLTKPATRTIHLQNGKKVIK